MPRVSRTHRLYDAAMDAKLLAATRSRRVSPDGLERRVNTAYNARTGKTVSTYPWNKMQLGDFFVVPLMGRTKSTMQVRFRQAANRRDWEVTVTPWKIGSNGTPGLRVAVTCLNITALKKKAQRMGIHGIRYSDGKWPETRAARQKAKKAKPITSRAPAPRPFLTAEEPTPLAVDAAIAETTEIDASAQPGYDRAAILRERLARLGA